MTDPKHDGHLGSVYAATFPGEVAAAMTNGHMRLTREWRRRGIGIRRCVWRFWRGICHAGLAPCWTRGLPRGLARG